MTEFFQVSPEASLESLRRQLGQWRGKRVALELPPDWLELDNVPRMRLLERQAVIQQVELALITQDRATRKAGRQVGIPVFAHPEQAAHGRWHMSPQLPTIDPQHPDADLPDPPPWRREDEVRRIARPTHFQARQRRIEREMAYRRPTPGWMRVAGTVIMGALIVAVLGAFTYYVLPAATITLTPGHLPLRSDIPLTAVVGLEAPDLEESQLPARLVQVELTEQGSVPTSGNTQKATDKALGEVVFSNLGNAPVTIPIGTRVTTSSGTPVEFVTTREALLESGVGTRVTVPVEAVEPGTAGNVRANTINSVSGSLRFRARVNNPGGTYGGGSALVPTVTEADKETLVANLQTQATAKAYESLAKQLEPGEWLPPESVQTFVIAQSFDQYNDEQAAALGGTLRILAQGMAVDEQEATDLILAGLERQVPERARLVSDSITVQRQPEAAFANNTVQFTMTVGADYTTPIDPDEVRSTVLGMAPGEAATALQNRWLLAAEPDIYLDPAWKGVLPGIGSRIQVRVEYGQQ